MASRKELNGSMVDCLVHSRIPQGHNLARSRPYRLAGRLTPKGGSDKEGVTKV